MCGRYAVTTDPARLAAEIDARNEVSEADADEKFSTGNYNVAPTTTVMTVVDRHSREPESDVERRVRAMRWGLVPPWTKAPSKEELGKGPLLFNARAESLAEKPAFRSSFKSKRALVPMDGWYEWKPGPTGPNGKPTKVPYFMSPEDGTRLFMGALWAAWRPAQAREAGDDSAWVSSTTIITTDAVGALTDVHHRMPLIMPFEHWDAWLDPDAPADPALLAPPAVELVDRITIREVSPLVNRVANNGPELLDPV
ncbi:SOS response-associated peptidase [Gordonia sp. HY442]|uniref:SOS response-associated peptidase n=1 Tax=Gordonia zhenghanii TaxID=2911516 RepID=UPI001F2FA13F|nr:SOS response-associated peptidase [Gordonia zhenghanii]MCF8606908.1 SOS response-associated peptidase [Gordonia zhenghanii]